MKPLIVLLLTFVITSILFKVKNPKVDYLFAGRIAMACMLCFTALGHFLYDKGMVAMLPNAIPFRLFIVHITGVIEILFGLGLVIPRIHKSTAYLIIIFFVSIIPSNIYAAINHINYQTGLTDGPGINYLFFRIPLQIVFILWVYFTAIKNPKQANTQVDNEIRFNKMFNFR